MKNEVNHILYNNIHEMVEIHFMNGIVKYIPMTIDVWESLFSNGAEYAVKKINELIYE